MKEMFDVTFNGVSPETFDKLRDRLTGPHEIDMTDEGVVDHEGVRCHYSFDSQARTLSISVVKTPSLFSQGYVGGWVHDAIRQNAMKQETAVPGGI